MAKEFENKYVLTAEDKAKAAFDSVERGLQRLNTAARTLGVTLSVGAFAGFVKHAIDTADELGKMSQKVGISVESLSALKYAADLSNVSMDTLTGGLGKLANTLLAASTGGREQAATLKALGVDMDALRAGTLTTDQAFAQIAKRVAGMKDSWQKTSLLQQAMGKSAKDLIPLLNDNADGFKAVTEEAKKFGVVISEDMAARAEQFNDNLTRLKAQSTGLGIAIANDLLKPLNDIAETFIKLNSERDGYGSFFQYIGEGLRLAAVAAGSFYLALRDMADGLAATLAQAKALATFDLDAFRAIGAARDEQAAKNKKQFEEFQATLLKHSMIFGDGGTESPPRKNRGAAVPDLTDLSIEKSGLRKFLEEIDRETEKLDLGPIAEKWMKAFQLGAEAGLTMDAVIVRARPHLDALRDAMFAQQKATEDAAKAWQAYTAMEDLQRQGAQRLEELQLETKLLSVYRENADLARAELQMKQQVNDAVKNMTIEQENAYRALADVINEKYLKALRENQNEQRKWQTGFQQSMNEITDYATNTAQQVHDLFANAFKSLEDTLVDFAMTGKLNFHDFAESVIRDLIRIRIQQAVIAPISAALSGTAGTTAVGSFLNFFGIANSPGGTSVIGAPSYGPTSTGGVPGRAMGGPVAANQPYWVGEQGPELFVPNVGGSIRANGKGGGNVYNIDARGADAAGLARLEAYIRSIDGTLEQRSVAAFVTARQRGVAGTR